MITNLFQTLVDFVTKNPVVLIKFEQDYWESLKESFKGIGEFSFPGHRTLLENVTMPAVCLIIPKTNPAEAYLAVISSLTGATTLEARIKIKCTSPITPNSREGLLEVLPDKSSKRYFEARLNERFPISRLSPQVSRKLIGELGDDSKNWRALQSIGDYVSRPKRYTNKLAVQDNALRTALAVFGIETVQTPQSLEIFKGRESAFPYVVPITEDAVIEHDARSVPSYELVGSDITGKAIFQNKGERLTIYTANRRPLEEVFGVDLIYLNETKGSLVMLQYKMLEAHKGNDSKVTDWIYRPDGQLNEEINRMKRFLAPPAPTRPEYRLHPGFFYLKFVKRDGSVSDGSMILSLEHFEHVCNDRLYRGPRGGVRISYNALNGRYLRHKGFVSLVSSGYIGAHGETTDYLSQIVEATLRDGNSVVAAVQSSLNNSASNEIVEPDF